MEVQRFGQPPRAQVSEWLAGRGAAQSLADAKSDAQVRPITFLFSLRKRLENLFLFSLAWFASQRSVTCLLMALVVGTLLLDR